MFTYPYLGDSYIEGFDDKGTYSIDSLFFFCDLNKISDRKNLEKANRMP